MAWHPPLLGTIPEEGETSWGGKNDSGVNTFIKDYLSHTRHLGDTGFGIRGWWTSLLSY